MMETGFALKLNGIDISGFRHLYPFENHYFERDGLRLHYLDEGRGEPVVMVHGNPTWSFYFRRLVSALSGAYRTIVPDHIGCGLSDKPSPVRYGYRLKDRIEDLEALLAETVPEGKINLVVHDWGGAIGLGWAVRHPERIGRLAITNTSAFFPPPEKAIPIRLRIIRNLGFLAAPLVLGLNAFAVGALYMAPKKRLAKDVKRGLVAPYNSWNNRMATLKFVQDIPLAPGDPSYGEVARIEEGLALFKDVPMLIMWGEGDFVFDNYYLGEWRRRFPGADVHVFPEAGHYLLEDEPERTKALIEDFLKGRR
jgi:haloalkane dehalogenase